MTHYVVVSVLPQIFGSFNTTGIIHRAIQSGLISIETINPRDHAKGRHRTVDDAPYGGGNGMLLKPDPLIAAMEAAPSSSHRVLLTPAGIPFDQTQAARLANFDTLTLICGRYEGFDARVEAYVDEEISIGDFVLLGGEVAAMALIEATARLQPGVLGNHNSVRDESHSTPRLEHPQYTRPPCFRELTVPEVLLSGDHETVARWRHAHSLHRTVRRRPDLLKSSELSDEQRRLLREFSLIPETDAVFEDG